VIPKRAIVRLIGATVAGLAMLSGSIGAAGAAGPSDSADSRTSVPRFATGATGLELTLTKVSPAAAGPDDEVVVTGTARNLGGTPMKNARISLWLRPEVLAGRKAINAWLSDGTLNSEDRLLPGTALIRTLASGQTSQFRIAVPPGETGLFRGSDFGPRAIALQARVGGHPLALLRSTIVWTPSEISTPTRLSVIVPITSVTPSTHAGEPTAEIAGELLPGGRLQRIVSAAHDPGMAWAIDPAILTAAQRLSTDGIDRTPDDADLTNPASNDPDAGDEPSSSAGPSGTSAATGSEITDDAAKAGAEQWLGLFRSERRGRGLFGLPYADPDLTSVLRSHKGIPLVRDSDALGKAATAKVLGGSIDTTLAWPADGQTNAATTRSLITLKRTTVILDGRVQQPVPKLDYTPTGRSTVRSSAGSLTGLLYDDQLSSLISSPASRTPAATQTLLAQLAAITMEQPGTGRHLLAVTPRGWNPEPTAVRNMMNALGSAPWISLRGISELRNASGPPRGKPVYRKAALKAELPIGSISAAQVLDRGLSTFAPILVDQAPVQALRERVASLISVSWRQDRKQLVPARIDVAADVNKLVGGVKLGTSSSLLFTARKNKIPVTVINGTDYTIKVVVRLKPLSGQLKFDKTETVTVEPHKNTPVQLEAQALANGDVVVEGRLLTTAGVPLGPGTRFTVRVRPDWESKGMIIIGSLLGLLLVIGLLRGLRRNRNRTRIPIEAVPDIDELATLRAADEAASETASRSGENSGASRTGPPSGGPTGSDGRVSAAALAPSARAVAVADVIPAPEARSQAGPEPAPDPDPITDPVPISMLDSEPDPKARGGPVTTDGVRPRMEANR